MISVFIYKYNILKLYLNNMLLLKENNLYYIYLFFYFIK